MQRIKLAVVFAIATLSAASAFASNFRAADLIYLPAAGRVQGATFFNTDVWISNLSDSRVVVEVAYAPTGNVDNREATGQAKRVALAPFAPMERREIRDVFKSALNLDSGFGQLIFFACREGGNCTNCGANAADCKSISVEARVYAQEGNRTFGQLLSGIPWYNMISQDASDRNLGKVFITGFRRFGSVGVDGFRSNLGLANASQFSSTTLGLSLYDGTQLLGTTTITLNPLAHVQLSIDHPNLFQAILGSRELRNGWVVIEQISATPVGTDPAVPGFLAYGSVLDNITNDPTTLEPQYFPEMDWPCIYGAKLPSRAVKR